MYDGDLNTSLVLVSCEMSVCEPSTQREYVRCTGRSIFGSQLSFHYRRPIQPAARPEPDDCRLHADAHLIIGTMNESRCRSPRHRLDRSSERNCGRAMSAPRETGNLTLRDLVGDVGKAMNRPLHSKRKVGTDNEISKG